jgi:Kef-type K+ transport system membrane component KefB
MMELLDILRSQVLALPSLAKFAIVIVVIAGVPPLARRVGLPEMGGLLLFGVLLGPHVLGFFGEDRPVADFFAELGKLLLMFSAGLEIDVALFRKELRPEQSSLGYSPPPCYCFSARYLVLPSDMQLSRQLSSARY